MTALDIDIYDADRYVVGVPHEDFKRLRAEAPVYRHSDPQVPEGFWALTRHADVIFVSRHPEIFSSHERTAQVNETPDVEQQQLMMLNMDPPDHTRLRTLVNRGFTPRMIGRLEEHVVEVCEQLVDDAVAKGDGDFVALCAAELPLIVIAELMGVPQEDRYKLFEWSNRMVGAEDPNFKGQDDAHAAAMEMFAYAHELAARKRQQLADDIVSKLISKDEEGNELTEIEFDLFFMLLAVAGNETTRNSISGGMLALINHPEQWARLKADRSLVKTAADEIVRYVTPVNMFRRTAMSDVEVNGTQIKKGDKVVIYYTSANRDEAVFDNADEFDVGRDPNPHLGFGGGGPHFCLGRHLAQLEMEVMFRTLLDKVERVELAGPVKRLRSNFLNGILEMPVRFIPSEV